MSSEEIVKLLRRCMFSDTLLQIAADKIEELESETNRQKAETERLQEYYKLYFERERTIKELQENIGHLQNKIVMYEKEIERSAWDLPPMGGFHDD